ncbi:hypothetical protein JQ604_16090 [Bradyrhizobium jicamae]|uniref:hypothetical protein n=1 Tax=Bradyrhizobium jicamae TaxID=280332 RepID=UPI001BA885F2|nr:hypothetical protein [Bradyrhizobium jicamae]MBR0753709.1 hypothetical protein [Bradyrhizobium jicamae]
MILKFAVGAGFSRALDVIRLAAALKDDNSTKKKRFWSIYDKLDFDPAELLGPESILGGKAARSPFWQTRAQTDEAFLSRKQICAIRDEIADAWKSILPGQFVIDGNHHAVTEYTLPDPELLLLHFHEFAHALLSETDAEEIELAIKRALEKRICRIRKFFFSRTRAFLRSDDAARVAIHRYRVRTGISPPEMEPNWTTPSSDEATHPFSRENSYATVRRRANRRRFQWAAPEGRARKRRTPSRHTNRHLARSHQAGGLPHCGAGTHR